MPSRLLLRRIMVPVFILMLIFLSAPDAVNADETTGKGVDASGEQMGAGGAGGHLLDAVSERMQEVSEQFSEAGKGLMAVPEWANDLYVKAQDPETLAIWLEMAGKVILVIAAGILAAWLAGRLLARLRRRMVDRETDALLFRGLFMMSRTLLDIIPVAVFAGVAYAVLPLTDPRHETRLIVLTLVNAGAISQVIAAIARLVLIPDVSGFRLVPAGEESLHYFYIWTRRLVNLCVYGYFILEAGMLMGVPAGLYALLMKFLGLAVTIVLVILVLQNKNDVAGWLRQERGTPEKTHDAGGDRLDAGKRGVFRRRFADLWHVPVIAIIVGTFFIWTLDVEGGLAFLLSGLTMTLVVILIAGLLVRLMHHGIDRLFEISEEMKTAFPGLEARADRYRPFLNNILKVVIYVAAVFSILEVWGLGTLGWLLSPAGGAILGESLLLVLIIAGGFLLWEFVSAMIERALEREATEGTSTRKMTLLPLLRTVVRITLVVIALMLVLSQIGINIGPLLAGAGVVGLAIGFGAQTLVRDVITGAFILMEDAISVGDWVEAGGYSGSVEHLTVRTLTLRDLAGTVHVVPFGEVTTVTNYNRDYGYALIDAGVAYRERYGDVVQALQDVAVGLRQDDVWGAYITGDLEVFGMNNLGDSAVEIRVRIKTRPMRQFAVRRVFLERMKLVFDERGIEIPFPHRTVWFGVDKDGAAPPMYLVKKDPETAQLSDQPPAEESTVRIASESEASEEVAAQEKIRDESEKEPGEGGKDR